MVQFDNQYRQVKIKIVYYGPALGGKTTCLQYIHRATDPQQRTKLYSLNTASDRTLFFDLLSLSLGKIRGYRLALQLYTVPGQVQYNATRRAVLSGVDGVVFVADSQVSQHDANTESLSNLSDNLAANGLDSSTVPIVFQYNKRDLSPLVEIEELEAQLNPDKAPSFPSEAINGKGVMEAFGTITEATLAAVAGRLGVDTSPQALRQLREQARAALRPLMVEAEAAVGGDGGVEITRPTVSTEGEEPLAEQALVQEAVGANVAMTDLTSRLDVLRMQLERKVRVLEGISTFGQGVSSERDPEGVLGRLLDNGLELLRAQAGSVIIVPASGALREAVMRELERDPMLATQDEAGEPLAMVFLNESRPQLMVRDLEGVGDSLAMGAVEAAGFSSAVAVPLVAQGRVAGLLTLYGDGSRVPLDEDDLQLATVLGSTAAMGYANAVAWGRLEDLNRGLESQVTARTKELRDSFEEVQRLAADLKEKNVLLSDAYRDISELDQTKGELITRISHELKTPITSLLTASKILQRSDDGSPETRGRFVTIIRDEAEKLSEIVQSVFQASILAASQEPPKRSPAPVQQLLKGALAPLHEFAKEREVALHVLVPADLETIVCESSTMEAALRAVIKNAVEFNHEGGEVKIEVRRFARDRAPWVEVKVVDSGVGIPDLELPRVFDTFWQGGNVLTGKPRGVGLGLAIAKRVVESHGGRIMVKSTVAEGTEVVLELPQELDATA
jgi:signal transduction histidine kinase/signal recognition particle receptor subunit beta